MSLLSRNRIPRPHRLFIVGGRCRLGRVFLFALLVFFLLFFSFTKPERLYVYPRGFVDLFTGNKLHSSPPRYEAYDRREQALPQHNLDLPFPEGRDGRYVKFSCQVVKLGWNNVLNELLMNAHLAYVSHRAYVFSGYIWKVEYFPWRVPVFSWSTRLRWPRTPLSALIAGPIVGDPWDPHDPMPRSISEDWFDVVCPIHERRIIQTRDIKPAVADAPGDVLFAYWARILREAPERCIEIVPAPRKEDNYPQAFDLYLWGSTRILPLWEAFSTSPTSRLLRTSPLVRSALEQNEHLFAASHRDDPYTRMMAMHVRRGDFLDACLDLANWNATFYSWNQLTFLPDQFIPPAGGSWGENTPENIQVYLKRCLPSFHAILDKIRVSKMEYEQAVPKSAGGTTLDVMYVLTNEENTWLEQLKSELRQGGWTTIVTSRDLELDDEQLGVSMAVDMDIARQAAVFIGNGWSSFTSNILHRRLVDGKLPITNRFW